jgi:cysteine synthase A
MDMAAVDRVTELIGNTPLVRLERLSAGMDVRLYGKMESQNPLSSVKDRIGLAMIEAAEAAGELEPGATVVEATSGNTGIALAYVGAVKGYRVVLTMPETMTVERRRLLQALGAELVLTPGDRGMTGAVEKANEIVANTPGAVLTRQFRNQANPEMHYRTTGQEIWDDTEGKIDVLVAGVGTGGTITGAGSRLKELKPAVRTVAVEPDASPVLSGGAPGPHKIQGIGAGFVPEVVDKSVIDEVLTVSADEATEAARRLAREEGILAGISAGANVAAALKVAARDENRGRHIVTIICDTGERYLSTWLFEGVEHG